MSPVYSALGLLPPLRRWVLWVAVPVWLALLTLAAWLRSLDGVASSVAADVIGSAAGVAFAATGAAAVLSSWQHRQLVRDVGELAAHDLNRLADHVAELMQTLLSMLADTIPVVQVATADDLAVMAQPPADPDATTLVLVICAKAETIMRGHKREGERAEARAHHYQLVAERLHGVRNDRSRQDPRERTWVEACVVAHALCDFDDNRQAQFVESAAPLWPSVPETTAHIASGARELGVLQVPGFRALVISVGKLDAAVETQWKRDTLDAVVRGDTTLSAAVTACRIILAEVVTVSVAVTAARADLHARLQGDGMTETVARHQIELWDRTVIDRRSRSRDDMAQRICDAWDALDESGTA